MSGLPALGITIGKFDPFHLGHDYLITEAKNRCQHLVVVVGGHPNDTFRAETRAGWVRDEHPDVEVIWTEADLPDEPEPWADHCLKLLGGRRPDVAFTSEDYGDAWAKAMWTRHESIDRHRDRFPISGTMIREDGWNPLYATPAFRAHMTKRVVICGAESTGTTTLARDLADFYKGVWVPEYGRYYWEGARSRFFPLGEWEFRHIAEAQARAEDRLAAIARRVVICDTDPLVTAVFARRYLGYRSEAVEKMAAQRVPNAYIITGDEIPWVQDGTRESGGQRSQMQEWIREAVAASGAPYIEVHGSPTERVEQAHRFLDEALMSSLERRVRAAQRAEQNLSDPLATL